MLRSPLFKDVTLTALGREQLLDSSSQIKGRERQFLLLLDRDDSVSQQVCAAMLHKVNVKELAQLGLVVINNNAGEDNKLQQVTKPQPLSTYPKPLTSVKCSLEAPTESFVEPNPMLQLAAGLV